MKISYNWLRQYIETDLTPEQAADKLTLLGLEVEEVISTGSDFEGFVIGDVLDVRPHPDADKLVLCRVNIGPDEVQIVCGARNVAAGQKVPVATVGATMPLPTDNGEFFTIRKAKLRGETSEGMICSEKELGLGDDHEGIMVLETDVAAGTPLNSLFNSESDTVFEIGLTPNRPDAACHIGVARDLAAVTGSELKNPYSGITPLSGDISGQIDIQIEDSENCQRYAGVLVDNVTIGESPDWLKNRLTSIGLRPINNVVDATNYVLHEIGQPLHAFDYDRIGGKTIIVKHFDEEIPFTTLDSIERKVPAGSLFICDGNGPVAIAGVMGGENSEVTSSTTKILIESAWFNPSSIRKTSKSLALQTDSSYRFERGIDPDLQLRAAWRAAELIAEISGGDIVKGFSDVHQVTSEPLKVALRPSRVNHLLGTNLEKGEIESILTRLEFEVVTEGDDSLLCTVPTFRPDVEREVDLIEEVGRVFDYNNIERPAEAPFIAPENLSELELFHNRVRHLTKNLRYKEISTNSLLSGKEAALLADKSEHVETLNPVSQENTTLRTHLDGGFLKAVRYNLNRNAGNIRFFEIGHVFRKSDEGNWVEGVRESVHLLLGLCGKHAAENWQGNDKPYTIFDIKADLESLLDGFGILGSVKRSSEGNNLLHYSLGNQVIATLKRAGDELLKGFDVEEEAFMAEVDLTAIFDMGLHRQQITYTPVPKFPAFEFDAAFIVDKDVRAGELSETIHKTAGKILQHASVFDIYEGENLGKGKKSIAFRLTFLDPNKTLNIKDVEPVVQKIVQTLEKSSGAKLRS
jgi:phenylalanyl-tRNA synthetase beta chain